jgi:glycine/D-amino acid oxidase-like deaminating enzyme
MLGYARASIEVHERLNLPLEVLDHAELSSRWPQIDFTGIEVGLYEAEFGALMARRAVQELVRGFVARRGEYRLAHAEPGANGHEVRLNGEPVSADAVIYAVARQSVPRCSGQTDLRDAPGSCIHRSTER